MKTVIAITGYSTSGKSYIAFSLPSFVFSTVPSHTNRLIRKGEVDGLDYHFVSAKEFASEADAGKFLECVNFCGYWYGLKKEVFDSALDNGFAAVHVCTPEGVQFVKEHAEKIGARFISVFVEARPEVIVYRMMKRWELAADGELEYIAHRLAYALAEESKWHGHYNYIVSDTVETGNKNTSAIGNLLISITKGSESIADEIERKPADFKFNFLKTKHFIEVCMRRSKKPSGTDQVRELTKKILKTRIFSEVDVQLPWLEVKD